GLVHGHRGPGAALPVVGVVVVDHHSGVTRPGPAARPVTGVAPASGRLRGMADDLTLMAVHAHPDDESSSTGGVLAAYGDAGVRTVVVTCTNGELGDAPGGTKPGPGGHD